MKELRDIKLDLLMGNQNPIVDLFNQITKDIKIINYFVNKLTGDKLSYTQAVEYTLDYFNELKSVGKFGMY